MLDRPGEGLPVTGELYNADDERLKLRPLHSGSISDYQDRRFIPPWDR
ncbi:MULTISPECIES: hypothetical protein [Rhizobium/Agrobacterium group]|nr:MULTISPECIES: hypothetical protein [Rhizobium/Agrobacterium group]BCH67854.1 hypothetical protein RvVAT039_pl06870 [Agrobacterium vitis]